MFIFIIALVVSTVITNTAQQLFMRMLGMNAMFFSVKKKLIAIVVIAIVLSTIILQLFGITIPK
jgi:hypothetical protein